MAKKSTTATITPVGASFRPQRYPALLHIVSEDVASPSLADRVTDAILQRIVLGKIAEGDKLRSTELAASLNVSRTPVAKAFAKLVADGILIQPNNHQAVVARGAENWLLEIFALRQLIEPEAAARAAGHMPDDVIEDLSMLMEDARSEATGYARHAAQYFDIALHLAIANFCRNLPMKVTIRKCWSYERLSYKLLDQGLDSMKTQYEQHRSILLAVADGDANRARKEMANHLKDVRILRDSRPAD